MEPAQYNDMAQRQPTGENEIIIYHPDKTLTIDVRVMDETVWLNRNQIAQLFGRDVKTIGKHINNALHEELEGVSVVAKFATTELSNSSFNALLICFPIVFTSLPNNSANCFSKEKEHMELNPYTL